MTGRLLALTALIPVLIGLGIAFLLAAGVLPTSLFDFRLLIGADVFSLAAGTVLSGLLLLVLLAKRWHETQVEEAVSRQQQSEIEVRRRFLQRLNHELKNPLTAMQAGLANLEGEIRSPASLDGVRRQLNRVSRLVTELQKLADLEHQEIEQEPVDLAAIVDEAVQLACAAPGREDRRVTVHVQRVPWHPSPVQGDRDLLFLALYNALDNALKFSSPEAAVEVRANEDGSRATIEIADTGCGIAAEDVPHVAEELYRGRDAGAIEGSGLGLTLVQRIVALHGGEMTLRSRAGEGTIVTLHLPLAP